MEWNAGTTKLSVNQKRSGLLLFIIKKEVIAAKAIKKMSILFLSRNFSKKPKLPKFAISIVKLTFTNETAQ